MDDSTFDDKLYAIGRYWNTKADRFGDKGTCVRGAKFTFRCPNGSKGHLIPSGRWQGSLSWEHCVEEIEVLLYLAGASEVEYDYGTMD
jgi:hypothetical protein